MESNRKPRTLEKLRRFLPRKEPKPSKSNPSSSEPPSAEDNEEVAHSVNQGMGHDQQVKARYIQAAKLLQDAVAGQQGESFVFPNMNGEMENFNDEEFRDKLNIAIEGYKTSMRNPKTLEKCRHAVQCVFTALSPFAKNFLSIARDGQAVKPPILFILIGRYQY